jgi:hypothetical protein
MSLVKKTNIMPPMEYRKYKNKTYLIDPKSPLHIGEFIAFLSSNNLSDVVPVAKKLKLVTEHLSVGELKKNIIKILQTLNITEPIEVPFKMKITESASLANAVNLGNANTGNANTGNANTRNAEPLKLSEPQPSSIANVNIPSLNPVSGNLRIGAVPSGVSLSGNTEQRNAGNLRLGGLPSGVNLSANTEQRNVGNLRLGSVTPSGVNLSANTEERVGSLRLGSAAPSGVNLSANNTEQGVGRLRLGSASPSRVSLVNNNNNIRRLAGNAAAGMNSLLRQVGGSRQSNVESVVNQTIRPPGEALNRLRRNIG